MSMREKVLHELRSVGITAVYFGAWIGLLVSLKALVLAEYHIEFAGLSVAAAGALVLSKVVLVLEHVPLGARVERGPAWVGILVRTLLYTLGLFLVMLTEKLVHVLRHADGGWREALAAMIASTDIHHVLATTICLSGALLVYNFWSVVRRYLGDEGLTGLLRRPAPTMPPRDQRREGG